MAGFSTMSIMRNNLFIGFYTVEYVMQEYVMQVRVEYVMQVRVEYVMQVRVQVCVRHAVHPRPESGAVLCQVKGQWSQQGSRKMGTVGKCSQPI